MRARRALAAANTAAGLGIEKESMGKDMSLLPEILGSVFEMSREPVLGIDSNNTVVFANPAVTALLGLRTGDSAAERLPEYILSDPAEQFIASHRIGDRHANISVRRLEGVTVCVWSLPRTDPAVLPQDLALEKLSSQLMSVRLALDALVRRTKAEDDQSLQGTVETLYQEYYRMLRSCRHMKLASGILQNRLPLMSGVTDLGTLCRELCDTVGRLFEHMGISVVFEADFGLHLTMADSTLLEYMLANLLSNSLGHCKGGDTIRVELSRQGERFIIAVQDTGSGISPEQMARLFNGDPSPDPADPAAGAGQGLFIARGIAERHGGAIIMESRPGQGTSVRVTIPYKRLDNLEMSTPMVRYRSDGMNTVLTEFSPLLDKKYYTRRMFD